MIRHQQHRRRGQDQCARDIRLELWAQGRTSAYSSALAPVRPSICSRISDACPLWAAYSRSMCR